MITRRASLYKIEHFFGKLKKGFKRLIINTDKILKNYYRFTYIAAYFILLSLSLWKIIYKNNLILNIFLNFKYFYRYFFINYYEKMQ